MILDINSHGKFCALIEALDQYVENCFDGTDGDEAYDEFQYLRYAENLLDTLNSERAGLGKDRTVTTTAGEEFTYGESKALAYLVYRRFGHDLSAATEAWRRMMQNSTTEEDFQELVDD